MGKSKFVLFAMALIFMSCQENARHISRDRFVKDNENFNVESWNNFHVSVRSAGFLFSYEVDPYLFNDRVGYCKSFVVIPQEERWYVRGRNNLMEDVDSLIYSIKWKEEYPELDASEFKNKFDWIVKNEILYLDCSNNICYVKSCNFNLMAEKDSISSPGHRTIWRDWPQGCYHEPSTKYDEKYLKGLHEKDKRL